MTTQSPSVKFCPFTSCGCRIPANRFACRKHWAKLGPNDRNAVWRVYEKFHDGDLTFAGLLDSFERIVVLLEKAFARERVNR